MRTGRRATTVPQGGWLTAFDQRLLDRLGAVESGVLDHALPRLGAAANYGRLWIGVAGLLLLARRRAAYRAAGRGLAGLVVAGAVANVAAKGVVRRGRPIVTLVPPVRWLFAAHP
jgi:hypothetical protein